MNAARTTDRELHGTLLSVVVPSFEEEAVLASAYQRLVQSLERLPQLDFELIFVDDGSRDRTLEILKELQARDHRVRVVRFSRNFGHQIAVTAGLEHSTGDAVVLIDADLQDPPEVIGQMVELWKQGVDVAYGLRTQRQGETAFKRWTAKKFYRFINRLSDVPIPLDTGDFRLMDRAVVNALLRMPERDRFVRGMVAWLGFRQEPVPYLRERRLAGESKYPLRKMILFATDGILSFSNVPLRLSIWAGFFTAGLAGVGLVYAFLMRLLTDIWVPGWTLLFIASASIGGMQLVFLGVLGEYIGRIYGEVKHRPLYIVEERLGFGAVASVDRSLKKSVSA